jgi:uncharacterized protein YigE (DUF2233 family)
MKKLLIFLSLFLCAAAARADDRFTVITVDPGKQDLRLFLQDDTGQPFKGLGRLAQWLEQRGQRLAFGMNAGMYHADFSPVGLLVQNGKEVAPLNLASGKGNFFLKPNGVFLLTRRGAQVVESSAYPAAAKDVLLATQSGPMLVVDGAIHPAFNPESQSRYIRNGVGVADGKIHFVISNYSVTFHELASFFRDELKCRDALYLDGSVSSLYAPRLFRNDIRAPLGPLIGVTETIR